MPLELCHLLSTSHIESAWLSLDRQIIKLINKIWLMYKEYSRVVTGLLIDERPMLCESLCMFVVSRGDMW